MRGPGPHFREGAAAGRLWGGACLSILLAIFPAVLAFPSPKSSRQRFLASRRYSIRHSPAGSVLRSRPPLVSPKGALYAQSVREHRRQRPPWASLLMKFFESGRGRVAEWSLLSKILVNKRYIDSAEEPPPPPASAPHLSRARLRRYIQEQKIYSLPGPLPALFINYTGGWCGAHSREGAARSRLQASA